LEVEEAVLRTLRLPRRLVSEVWVVADQETGTMLSSQRERATPEAVEEEVDPRAFQPRVERVEVESCWYGINLKIPSD
jgi:hypothetical protein